MDAGVLAKGLLLLTLREPVLDGGVRVSALVALPAGEVPPATTFDGCDAAPIGTTERAQVAWAIAFDPAYVDKERFRDGRQLALYFVTHLGSGDRMNVSVLGPGASASGWRGLEELTALRAPLDRTVDPVARAGASDAPSAASIAAASAPTTGIARHASVAIYEDGSATVVQIAAEGLAARESFAAGESQARGPRFVAEIAAQMARVSRASWSLACAPAPGPADPPPPPPLERTSRNTWILGAALFALVFAFALVWRARRRG